MCGPLAAEYRAGATLEELARRHGMAAGTVRLRLLAASVQLWPPGRRPVGTPRLLSRPMAVGLTAMAGARRYWDAVNRSDIAGPGEPPERRHAPPQPIRMPNRPSRMARRSGAGSPGRQHRLQRLSRGTMPGSRRSRRRPSPASTTSSRTPAASSGVCAAIGALAQWSGSDARRQLGRLDG